MAARTNRPLPASSEREPMCTRRRAVVREKGQYLWQSASSSPPGNEFKPTSEFASASHTYLPAQEPISVTSALHARIWPACMAASRADDDRIEYRWADSGASRCCCPSTHTLQGSGWRMSLVVNRY